jgi:hypothetical protein
MVVERSDMSKKEKAKELARVKRALAEKYDRLARFAKGKPKQKHLKYRAEKAGREAREALRGQQASPTQTSHHR